jgi:hypothetical protein
MKSAVWGSVDIFARSRLGINPYVRLSMSDHPIRRQKEWFFLRNDVDALLPVFTCSHPVPQPNWGYGVAQRCIRKLQPLCDIVRRLLQDGLTGVNLLQTFISRRIQPLR